MSKTAAHPGETTEFPMAGRQIGGIRDATDEKLVSLLRRNARMTLTALAHELAHHTRGDLIATKKLAP